MTITLQSADRQAIWKPTWLIEIAGTQKHWAQLNFLQNDMIQRGVASSVPVNFAGTELVISGTRYRGLILEEPTVEKAFTETVFGLVAVSEASFRLANGDQALDGLYAADPRGVRITLKRYDRSSGTTITDLTGVIEDCAQGEGFLELTAVAPDLSVFLQDLPKGTVTAASFPKAVDMGATIPVVFGNVERMLCPHVNDDTTNNQYDYLIGRGSLTISALYRDGPNGTLHLIGAGEYTVETTRYSGLTTVRFTTRQVNFSNAFHKLYADVTGLSAERNFARAVKTLLSDSTYGLGQSVKAASFTTAEAALNTVGSLFCDAALTEPRVAEDILRDLLMIRGMRLDLNSSGEWTISVDTEQTTARLAVRDGAGAGERTLVSMSPRRRRLIADAVRTYILHFRPDLILGGYRLEATRAVHAGFGSDRILESDYVRDPTTADKIVDYLAKRERYGQDRVEVVLTQEARQLAPGELVIVTSVPLGYSAEVMEVESVRKGTTRVEATLRGWNADIYVYSADVLPVDSDLLTLTATNVMRPDVDIVTAFATGGTAAELGIGVDTASKEIDMVARGAGTDILWGEATYTGDIATDFGVKYAASTRFVGGAVSDQNNDLQLALFTSGGNVDYARVDKDGVNEQSPINLFLPGTGRQYKYPLITARTTSLYWMWVDIETATSTLNKIRYGKTSLTGVVETSDTLIADHSGDSDLLRIATGGIAVDSVGDVHIIYGKALTGDPASADKTATTLRYIKVKADGTSLIAHKQIASTADMAGMTFFRFGGLVVDSNDQLHVIVLGFSSSLGVPRTVFYYLRLDLQGNVIVEPVGIGSQIGTSGGDVSVAIDSTLGDIYYASFNDTTKLVLHRLSKLNQSLALAVL